MERVPTSPMFVFVMIDKRIISEIHEQKGGRWPELNALNNFGVNNEHYVQPYPVTNP